MNFFVIRHAEAADSLDGDDRSRPLTQRGVEQSTRLGNWFATQKIALDLLITSPLIRAVQTGDAIAASIHLSGSKRILCEEIAPEGDKKKMASAIEKRRQENHENIAVVGHLPSILEWTAWLIGSKQTQLEFRKASMALLEINQPLGKGCGTLRWLISPEWLH